MGDRVRWIGYKVDEIIDLFKQAKENLEDIKHAFDINKPMSHLTSYWWERTWFNDMKF